MGPLRHARGISTMEYVIIFSVVVLVSIGALAMLGGNTKLRFEGMGGSYANGSANGAGTQAPPIDVKKIGSIKPIRGADGSITGYQVTMDSGVGTQVTSVEGDVVAAAMVAQMKKLLEQLRASGADPLVEEAMKKLAQQMGIYSDNLGFSIQNEARFDAENQQIIDLENSGNHAGPPYHSTEIATSVFAQTEAFLNMNNAYNELNALLTARPQYADLQAKVNETVGVMSMVAIEDQMADTIADTYSNRISPNDLGILGSTYPQSLGFLAGITGEASQKAGTNDGSDAYYDSFNSAFRDGVMSTASTKWMGDSNISLANF